MKQRKTLVAGLGMSVCLLSACANDIPAHRKNQQLIPPSQRAVGLRDARPDTIFLTGMRDSMALGQPLRVNANNVALIRILNSAAPRMQVVAEDSNVDLSKEVSVQIKSGTLGSLLDQLTSNANYAFHVKNRTIHVSSRETKTWNLAAFATRQNNQGSIGQSGSGQNNGAGGQGVGAGGAGGLGAGGGGGVGAGAGGLGGGGAGGVGQGQGAGGIGQNGGGAGNGGISTQLSTTEGEWEAVVRTARGILGVDTDGDQNSGNSGAGQSALGQGTAGSLSAAEFNSSHTKGVVAIRSMGLIRATGEPRRVQRLDKWITHLQDISTEQYHLDVKTMEVTLRNDQARGINWQGLVNGAVDGLVSFAGPVSTSDFASTAGGLSGQFQDDDFGATVQFLSQFGEVNLVNEPNVTTTNGRTANFTTGRQFSYVSTITTTVVEGGTTIQTPQLQRLLVGVQMAVTPRRLDDGRILLNVVPVITNLQGFTEISLQDSEFRTPNVRLQSLATQVITRPGVPVHIGGLISSQIRNTLNTLPIRQKLLKNPLRYLFTSEDESMQRRELVIMITPSPVDP